MDNQKRAEAPYFISNLRSRWLPETGATMTDMRRLHACWNQTAIPDDLLQLLQWSDGGRCRFPNAYIDLWPISGIIELNVCYQIPRYLGAYIMGFGTDGASMLLAVDLHPARQAQIVSFDLGDLDADRYKPIATSVADLFHQLDSGLPLDDIFQPWHCRCQR